MTTKASNAWVNADALNKDKLPEVDINKIKQGSLAGNKTPQGQWKEAFQEFAQSTTMHGLSRIAEETPFTLRR